MKGLKKEILEGSALRDFLLECFQSEPGKHFLNAEREFLLGVRALVDKKIERIEKASNKGKARKVAVK
jgi:hypothetical protein